MLVSRRLPRHPPRSAGRPPVLVVTVDASLLESGEWQVNCTAASGEDLIPGLTMPKDYRYNQLQGMLAKQLGMSPSQVGLVSPTGDVLEDDGSFVSRTTTKARAPEVNTFDLVEQRRGARSSATPAQRAYFEQRCQNIYRDVVQEEWHASAAAQEAREAAGSGTTIEDLQAMFPSMDPSLVQSLYFEATSPQQALDTLIALSASVAEPVVPTDSIPPKEIGVEDDDKFPLLVDSDGWQVVGMQALQHEPKAELGSAWRDRAQPAAALPRP